MFRRVWDVLNEYKAELVASSSWWTKEMITVSTEISPAPSEARMKRKKPMKSQACQITRVKRCECSNRCDPQAPPPPGSSNRCLDSMGRGGGYISIFTPIAYPNSGWSPIALFPLNTRLSRLKYSEILFSRTRLMKMRMSWMTSV